MSDRKKGFYAADFDDEEEQKKGFYAKDLPVKEYDQGQLEAGLRGLGQSFFGLGDEAVGAAKSAADVLGGKSELSGLLERYKKYRDEERDKVKEAYEKYPKTAYAAEIAGGFIPGIGIAGKIGKLGSALKTGAGMGALSGLGSSEAELSDLKKLSQDVAVGATAGAIGEKVIGKSVDLLKKYGPKLATRSAQVLTDVPADVMEKYVKGKSKFGTPKTPEEIAIEFQEEVLPRLYKETKEGSSKSKDVLSKSSKLRREDIENVIKSRADELEKSFGGIYDLDDQVAALKKMRDLQKQYGKSSRKTGLVDKFGNQIELEVGESIDPIRLKRTIQSLDQKIDYPVSKDRYVTASKSEMMQLRKDLDKLLKDNPEYASVMKDVAEDTRLLKDAQKMARTTGGFKNIFRRVGREQEGSDILPKDVIERLDKKYPELNLLERASFSSASEALEKDLTRGSKNVQKFANIFGSVGSKLPGGENLGRALGSAVGSSVDHFGSKAVKSALDKVASIYGPNGIDPTKYGILLRTVRTGVKNKVPESLAVREILRNMNMYEE